MTDWSGDLNAALASGDPSFMRAMLARVPPGVLRMAIPYLSEMAKRCLAEGRLPEALVYYDQLLEIEPGNLEWHTARTHVHSKLDLEAERMRDAAPAPEPPSEISFDPTLLHDPSIPNSFEKFMVDGLRQHLRRYSAQLSCRNSLVRLDDPAWLAAWDTALSVVTGSNVLCIGSELGVFALRALHHGATRVLVEEISPVDANIASGMVQKHFLMAWHALHGAAIQLWSERERLESFASFARGIDVLPLPDGRSPQLPCEYFVFPHIDHSLLGTGIVTAIRKHRQYAPDRGARVLPARATIHAMAIQWVYPSVHFHLQPMNQFRWSLHPQALELPPESWTALTAPTLVGEVDFANFAETLLDLDLPIVAAGSMDAIVYWFELDFGHARISNAPGSGLRCIKPAVQYTDPTPAMEPGQSLRVRVHIKETRLHFETRPATARLRSYTLPGWYIPMLLDQRRNDTYRAALERAMAAHPAARVLDIGAGCGLLSMMAAQAGAGRVVGCEQHPAICQVGNEIVKLNGCDDRVMIVNKECRSMTLADGLGERADLAVFELFDCSLIGEGILHFLAYAREHLLTSNARFLPASATVRAMLIEYRLDRLWDIDLNLLNPYRFSPAFINVDASRLAYRALTEPFDLFCFDFSTATPVPERKELSIAAIRKGIAGALLFWFDLQLDTTCRISNAPGAQQSFHWRQGLQFLPEVQVDESMQLPLVASHDGSGLSCGWQQETLPQEVFSRLPRFDPRWLAAAQELEQQTHRLLQHCRDNPREYIKVAELAQRFAIDPAAHDLDPVVAQRFAMTFLSGTSP